MLPILTKTIVLSAAAIAVGMSATPKTSDANAHAYAGALARLEASDFALDARRVFQSADLDANGALGTAEYAALAIVDAELARLNGFIAFEVGGKSLTVATSPNTAPLALTFAERTRIDAVATREFHAIAGPDAQIDASEYEGAAVELFTLADRNRDGAIAGDEFAIIAAARLRASHGRA